MKKKIRETDFIGGQGSLTEKERLALREFFDKKKKETTERRTEKQSKKKGEGLILKRHKKQHF